MSGPDHSDRRTEIGIAPANHVYGPARVHLLPCKIHHYGSAPVATYFRPTPLPAAHESDSMLHVDSTVTTETDVPERSGENLREAENRNLPHEPAEVEEIVNEQKWECVDDAIGDSTFSRFRGRKLTGRNVALPEGVHGIVMRERPCPEALQEDGEDLTSFWAAETYFNDVSVWGHDEVRRESPVDRCLEWLKIAKSIHDP